MKVELIDLKKRYLDEKKELLNCFQRVVGKGSLVLTDELENFENKITKYTGAKYCLGLNSGTDALMMGLWALGIKKGDEVITSTISFIASAGAIFHLGAKPVFVDVCDDLNIDPDLIERSITSKTKAIMPVHWSGKICKMDKIKKISKKYGIPIIEDSAQGIGSYYKKIHSGNFGKVSAFSAHPLKNLNALGDSGFLVTNNKKIYEKVKLYRNHGLKSRDNVVLFGVNSRLDSLNAEVLSFRLKKLKNIILKRRKNISLYKKYIKTNKVQLPNDSDNSYDSYVMMISKCKNRNGLKKYLNSKGVQSLIYYGTPLHLHKASKKIGYKKGDFPNSEKICNQVLSFPHHQYLTEREIKYVSQCINDFYG
tara:strand:- start:1876 stop:2973 length:1098 start_codon:yes stop_codon:yes gene_type:complete